MRAHRDREELWVEDLRLEGHGPADGRHQGRQLVVALLQGDVHVGPRLVDPQPERDPDELANEVSTE